MSVSINPQLVSMLQARYGALETMDPNGPVYKGICEILDESQDEVLVAIRDADIKWVSVLAGNRCRQRGL